MARGDVAVSHARRLLLCLLFCAVMLGPPPAEADTQPAASPTLSCALSLSQAYPIGQWTPVTLRLSNPTDAAIDGAVNLLAGRDNALVIRQPAHVPAHSELTLLSAIQAGLEDKQQVPAGEIARAVWRDGGREICRASLSGFRIGSSPSAKGSSQAILPQAVLLIIDTATSAHTAPPDGAMSLDRFLSDQTNQQIARAQAGTLSLVPYAALDYGGCQFVVLQSSPDELSLAQRQALLDFIDQGGTLIVSAADPSMHLDQSWLQPYLPVTILGSRQASVVGSGSSANAVRIGPLFLISEVTVCKTLPDSSSTSTRLLP